MDTPSEKFEMWARVDLFGHNQRVGRLSVTNTGVEILYRLDVPQGDGMRTEFYGKGAIYSIMPVSEEVAHIIAKKLEPAAPISEWDLPEQWRSAIQAYKAYKALPAQVAAEDHVGEMDMETVGENADSMSEEESPF